MINIFLSALIIMCSISMFSISYKINGLNRTIINAPIDIFTYAVPLVGDDLEVDLAFDQTLLERKYKEYLETTVYKFVSSYSLNYRYYYPENDAICRTNCKGVEISFSAPIMITYKFNRTMFYEITEGR